MIGGKGVTKTSFHAEQMSMISTIQRSKTGQFTDKSSSIIISITKGEKSKNVGMLSINLADYIDGNDSMNR